MKAIHKAAGPIVGILVYFLMRSQGPQVMALTAGIAVWMAYWWITEAINIYFTGLLPVFLYPLCGILPMQEVSPLYMKDVLFLFIGGFIIAYAFERWNLHKRIALGIILRSGSSNSRILLGFMLASYVLSMWILNTATTTMLLPAALAVINQFESLEKQQTELATPLLLGLAFASSIGGTTTLIGTAPNLILKDFYSLHYPDLVQIDFANWFFFALPLSFTFLLLAFFVLRRVFMRHSHHLKIDMAYCKNEYARLGPVSYEEKVLGYAFIVTVLLWFFMNEKEVGGLHLPGWSSLLPEASFIKESTIAMLMAAFLFVFPAKNKRESTLVSWKEVQRIPVGIIFLFGGGFALAEGVSTSGLSDWLGARLGMVEGLSPFLLVLVLCLFTTFFTELASNTASTILLLTIMLSMAGQVDVHPLLIMLPVTLSASYAFMLPVATPPNTIVFGSERLHVRDMMRAGIWLNLCGALLVSLATFTLLKWVFGIDGF